MILIQSMMEKKIYLICLMFLGVNRKKVSATGTFVKNSTATWDLTGTSGIPSGWTVVTADS